jgi:surface polysaccharide O-acyltransferase-like enzyme
MRDQFPEPADREPALDLVRALACVFVVVIHTSGAAVANRFTEASFHLANVLDSLARPAVPLFVILSGALLLRRPIDDWSGFYRKAILRLGIPLAAWTAIYVALRYLKMGGAPFVEPVPEPLLAPLRDIVTGTPYYHLWYLYMIAGLYLLTPLIERGWRHCSRSERIAAFCTAMALGMAGAAYDFALGSRGWWGLDFMHYLGFFLFGGLIVQRAFPVRPALAIAGYLTASALTALTAAWLNPRLGLDYLYTYLSPTTVAASLFLVAAVMNCQVPHRRWIGFVARHALGIYLVHPLVLELAYSS